MANRYMNQFVYTFEQKPCVMFAKVTIGATGAPTLVTASSKGIKSITRNSTGDYTLLLSDTYNSLLHFKHIINSGSSAPTAPGMYIKSDAVSSATVPGVEFVMNAAGTPTDPASGEILYLEIVLRNSSK